MITVPEATKTIVERSRYLSEAISKDIINLSSLARYIKPELETMLVKEVGLASIIMALARLRTELKPQIDYKQVFKTVPEMIVRSNLIALYLSNSQSLTRKYPKLLKVQQNSSKLFFTFTSGPSETTIITNAYLEEKLRKILGLEKIVAFFTHLSSITIQLPKSAMTTPGIYYFLLKSLAWEGINILETVSTHREFTLILENKETNRAFIILRSLIEEK